MFRRSYLKQCCFPPKYTTSPSSSSATSMLVAAAASCCRTKTAVGGTGVSQGGAQRRHASGFADEGANNTAATAASNREDEPTAPMSPKRQQHLASKSAARLKKVDLRALTKSNSENQYLQTDILDEGLTATIYRSVIDYKERRAKQEESLQEADRQNLLEKEEAKKKKRANATTTSSSATTAATATTLDSSNINGGDTTTISDDINQTGKATPKQIRQLFHDSVKARTVANTSLRRYLRSLPQGEAVLAKAAVEGCQSAGLVLDNDTSEEYLEILMSSGFMREGLQLYQHMIRNKTPPNTRAYNCLMRLCVSKNATESALKLFDEMTTKGRQQDRESYEIALNAIASQQPVDWARAVQIFEKATGGTQQALRRANILEEEAEAEEMRQGTEYTASSSKSDDRGARTGSGGSGTMMRAITGKGWKESKREKDQGDLQGLPASSGFTTGRHHSGTALISASTYNALMRVYLNMQPFEWRVVYNCYYEMRNNKPKIRITWESYALVAEAMRRGEAGRFRRLLTYLDAWFQLTNLGSWRFVVGFFVYGCIGLVIKAIMGFFVQRSLVNSDKTVIAR